MMDCFGLVIPTAVVTSIFLCAFGPLYLPYVHLIYLTGFSVIFGILSFLHAIKFRITSHRIRETLLQAADLESKGLLISEPAYIHTFIIPNYNEPIGLLRKTINRISEHIGAQERYIIVLAMEATEADYLEKATILKQEFTDMFKHFIITCHPANIEGESRGKGSNVNWAVRHACKEILRFGLSMKQIVLTVCDSDASIPELYIQQVERNMTQVDDPYSTIFCPPIFFSKNNDKIPASVRVTDVMWSVMVMQNLSNPSGIVFPCSNYSLSMVLADKVNYWDTSFDAIGEDMHMMLKCFFKTGGVAKAKPIYVPINLTNVQTSSYISNMYARYVQSTRHYFGVADVAYTLRNASQPPKDVTFKSLSDRILISLLAVEAHLLPAVSGWIALLGPPLLQLLNPTAFDDHPLFASMYFVFKILTGVCAIPVVLNALEYESLHRTVDSELFKKSAKDSRKLIHILDYLWLPFSAIFFMTLPSSIACLKKLIPNREEKYIVAEKMDD